MRRHVEDGMMAGISVERVMSVFQIVRENRVSNEHPCIGPEKMVSLILEASNMLAYQETNGRAGSLWGRTTKDVVMEAIRNL